MAASRRCTKPKKGKGTEEYLESSRSSLSFFTLDGSKQAMQQDTEGHCSIPHESRRSSFFFFTYLASPALTASLSCT